MYSAREQSEILKELQSNSGLSVSKTEGTFEYDVFSSNSIEFYKLEIELEQLYKMAFADTAVGDFLTMRCAESGIVRKEAVKATGTVTVTGNGDLPIGSQFATATGMLFATTEAVTVNKTADVPCEAVTAGTAGNVLAGEINSIPASISGITGVINNADFTGGYDQEGDASLLSRYLLHVRTPGTSGNAMHYYEWATSVAGVGGAKVLPTWNGPNTVKVIIVDANKSTADEKLLNDVYNYIETVRPIGAEVTVVSARNKTIDVAVTITGSVDTDTLSTAIKEYFKSITTSYVSMAKIADIIYHQTGVEDYRNLLLNGTAGNITLSDDELPILGSVVVS